MTPVWWILVGVLITHTFYAAIFGAIFWRVQRWQREDEQRVAHQRARAAMRHHGTLP